jgi:HlyD family secretion protein
VRIPTEAVVQDGFVFVLHPETRRVERRRVETGIFNWRFTEVIAGLDPGELVVTSVDRRGLAEGVLVEVENHGTTTARR